MMGEVFTWNSAHWDTREKRENKRDEKKTYDHQERKVMGNPNPNA